MKIIRNLSFTMVVVFLLGLAGGVHAERGDAMSQQQELQKALEMMKKQGMDDKTQKQMENMFKNMSEAGAKQQSAKLKKEQQKFEAETAGHGTAQVEVGGKQYELKMIKCEITDRNTGSFSLHARQAPGKDSGELWVGGGPSRNNVQFILGKKDPYEVANSAAFHLNGKDLEWQGTVIRGGNKEALKFRLTCGAEMVDYATPSQPNPSASVNVLTLQIGQETNPFQTGYCSTKEYRTGNLIVEFEATATGTFRGRPAIILLSKSHAAKEYGGEYFQNMDLLLGELTPEQRILSSLKVAEQLRNEVQEFSNKEMAAIQKKFKEKMAAYQKQFDAEMPSLKKKYGPNVPQDKMAELMDPMNKLMDTQSKEMDKVQEQTKAMTFPKGRSFGTITVKGREVHFGGSKLSTQDASRAPEFQNLPAKTELWVTCGE